MIVTEITMALSTNKGFTLLELITVIALMAIMAAIAIPSFWVFMDNRRLNGAARLVMGDMLSARAQAITENNNFRIIFLTDNRSYRIISDRNNDGIADPGELLRTVNIQDYYRNVTMSSNNNPIFSPRGTAANLATVTLTNPAGSRTVTVAITGRVRIN